MVDFNKHLRRYDERGRLLHKPKYTTREFLQDLDESERERNLREAREGWAERSRPYRLR